MQLKERLREKFPFIIAILCGILAILLLNAYLRRRESEIWERIKQAQQQTQPAKPPEKTGIVLLAKRDISTQTPITPGDLVIREIPVQYIQPRAVTSLDQVIGKIASAPIAKGEQMLRTKLLPPGKIGKTLSEVTPEGKRAVTVEVDIISSLGGLLKPGDYVDVFGLISPPSGTKWPVAEEKKAVSRIVSLFQGVEVLAVGSEFVVSVSPEKKTERARKTSRDKGVVTLALKPQEAILLSFVQEHGEIRLALRSSEDVKIESIKSADWDALFEYLYPSREPVFEGEQPVVEIYRGLRREAIPLSEGKK